MKIIAINQANYNLKINSQCVAEQPISYKDQISFSGRVLKFNEKSFRESLYSENLCLDMEESLFQKVKSFAQNLNIDKEVNSAADKSTLISSVIKDRIKKSIPDSIPFNIGKTKLPSGGFSKDALFVVVGDKNFTKCYPLDLLSPEGKFSGATPKEIMYQLAIVHGLRNYISDVFSRAQKHYSRTSLIKAHSSSPITQAEEKIKTKIDINLSPLESALKETPEAQVLLDKIREDSKKVNIAQIINIVRHELRIPAAIKTEDLLTNGTSTPIHIEVRPTRHLTEDFDVRNENTGIEAGLGILIAHSIDFSRTISELDGNYVSFMTKGIYEYLKKEFKESEKFKQYLFNTEYNMKKPKS